MRVVNLVEFWCFPFNFSSSTSSFRQFNGCLFVSLITIVLKTKTDQDASEWGAEGLVLTDVGSAESKGFESLILFGNWKPIQSILVGKFKICLWLWVGHEMTLSRQMSSFSGPAQTFSLALWGISLGQGFPQKK